MKAYFNIWLKTKITIDQILTGERKFYWQIPCLLVSLSTALFPPLDFSTIGIIFFSLEIIIYFFIAAYVFPAVIYWIGKIWKGKTRFKDIQIIFSLALIPSILTLITQLLGLAFYQEVKPLVKPTYAISLIEWFFVIRILVIGISKAQKFSYGIALLNIVLFRLFFAMLYQLSIS